MTFQNTRTNGYSHRPLNQLQHPREVIRQFTPNWFAATMGTGILSIALSKTPLFALGEALWLFNIVLFTLFSVLLIARWAFFFDEAMRVFNHPVVSMFFGCIPMGLATVLNGFLIYGTAHLGDTAAHIAETLWWIDVGLSVLCGIAVPYLMFTRQDHSVEQMTAVWLLPMVAAEVAAVSGGLLAPHLVAPQMQMMVLVLSYVLWALSVPIAMGVIVILLLRLVLHKLPHASMAATSWLALGPIGTGALGLMTLGDAAPAILRAQGLEQYSATFTGVGLIGGLLLWGYGLWWLSMAALITLRYLREGLPFNLGWWGYTFPLGVFSVATVKLGVALHLALIGGLADVLIGTLAVIWLIVGTRTALGAWHGTLFSCPCLCQD
ncbi:TDT family transporter [Celeribacter halophilus]|uniref:TDT family transporter n=1 Tax=Celeribacter halophilus TaxID=576117 RepID=UPI003A8FC3F0